MPPKLAIDRSLAFTVLLENQVFRKLPSPEATAVVTRFLADWHNTQETDMYAFGMRWAAEHLKPVEKGQMNLSRLEKEIRDMRGTIQNGIDMRDHHPSFGYTKAGLRAEFHQLQGMVMAWAFVTGHWSHGAALREGSDLDHVAAQIPPGDGNTPLDLAFLRFAVEAS